MVSGWTTRHHRKGELLGSNACRRNDFRHDGRLQHGRRLLRTSVHLRAGSSQGSRPRMGAQQLHSLSSQLRTRKATDGVSRQPNGQWLSARGLSSVEQRLYQRGDRHAADTGHDALQGSYRRIADQDRMAGSEGDGEWIADAVCRRRDVFTHLSRCDDSTNRLQHQPEANGV